MNRTLDDIINRWQETQAQSTSISSLQKAVKYNGPTSPCVSGLRSLCWKTFLLSRNSKSEEDWFQFLRDGRKKYAQQREPILKYVKHPEALAELSVDPLADDPSSPWDTARQDEAIRAEIQQDVQRLPDEVNYHDERIQTLILDVLFMYCKTFPERGGYRQGMHELLAPIVHVLDFDSINLSAIDDKSALDPLLLELVDASFVEHDSFLLFSTLMENAQYFYVLGDSTATASTSDQGGNSHAQTSTIVERSKFIHEDCLQKVDPELASHLTNIEILPQIFLIRWIRLLFSREFPFDKFLVLWDTIFAVDPSLELVDLICVAMLIRIRWKLLEADYSVCLQLLLKYPAPDEVHGPHTFVDDAEYLRGHLNVSGASTLVMKYTGKLPSTPKSPDLSRPTTPSFRGFTALRQRALGARSPLGSPTSFKNQQASVEALFQGAAKSARGVFERGEKLGINQAVRDAMGEIRRNMQGFNESRLTPRFPSEDLTSEDAVAALSAMERRNQQLANMLDDTVRSLKEYSASSSDEKAKTHELIEIAAAKIQFVKIYLEDPTMELPSADERAKGDGEAMDTDEWPKGEAASGEAKVDDEELPISSLHLRDDPMVRVSEDLADNSNPETEDISKNAVLDPLAAEPVAAERPAPIPTRSTLAQSSFSWMLEPTEPASSALPPPPSKSSISQGHKKRSSNNTSREKNAFLFGEVKQAGSGRDPLGSDDIFGMEPINKR